MRLVVASLAVLACLQAFAQPSRADTRVALVIGNGAYQNAPRLPNPRNDAEDVAAALKRSGFDTISGSDMDKVAMEDAAVRFARAARTADVAVFYYSGHAIQFAGVNYLAPVDIKLTDEADLHRMVRLDDIVADVQQARNLRIVVLDACRDNPLADELKRSIGTTRALPLQRGLAKIDAAQGMIVAYATQAGRTAEDGMGRNSPYTSSFLKHIEEPEEIGTIFRRVSSDVYEATRHSQLPELSLSLIGEFYLQGRVDSKGPLSAVPSTAPATQTNPRDGQEQPPKEASRSSPHQDNESFDGAWTFTSSGCRNTGTLPAVITGGRIIVQGGSGQVGPDGTLHSVGAGNGMTLTAVGQLLGNTGAGTFARSDGCRGRWIAIKQ